MMHCFGSHPFRSTNVTTHTRYYYYSYCCCYYFYFHGYYCLYEPLVSCPQKSHTVAKICDYLGSKCVVWCPQKPSTVARIRHRIRWLYVGDRVQVPHLTLV